ncbi:MAG TPA: DUF885 domain-containing protein, partial [Chitinophagales bacterium]|nr:DUF885 domain-containing protein [Chitinophagales bacterium]
TAEEIAVESKKVNDFLDRKYDEQIARHPEEASSLGLKTGYDSWDDRSDEADEKELAIFKASIDTLKSAFNLDALDAQTRLSVQMIEEDLKRYEEGEKWRHYGYELSQMGGINNDIPAFLINVHKVDSLSDALAYLSRLKKLDNVFGQTITNLKKSEAIGVMPPYFTFSYVTSDLKSFIDGCDKKDASNLLLSDFSSKVDKLDIDKAVKDSLENEAAEVIKTTVKSSYQKLLDYWLALAPKAEKNGSKGAWNLPNGDAYYAYCLEWNTTTTKTPEEIYQIGLSEVARIQAEMHAIMKQVNFKSDSLQDFFHFVLTDKQFKYSNDDKGRAELLADANGYIDSMRVKLPDLFATQPKAQLVVKQVEKFREKSVAGAFYEDPAEDGSRPGRYYVNTYNMDDEPKYQMEALTYHEAIPGHHMQISIAQELKGIAKFRKHEFFTAYVEGWALYAEQLGKEVGKYQDPYSDFGRLSMELFRAARLVVDVGIHNKHWTREQAIDYFEKNTANAKGDIRNEIERYFIWPGQATGYKIGMLKILELREKAKKELGGKFDIRQFHDVVLTNGAVSLTTLEDLVNQWIAEKKKG